MDKVALKEFLQKKYENPEAFLENVIFPVFGEDNYDDSGSYHWLRKHPEDQTAAENSGILDILVLGSIYVEGSQLDIFDITVASKHQLANSRVGIQQLVRRIISTHSGAFMIFHYKTTECWDWRFTFCHKGASQLDSSDAKRYTFLLGPGQSCRTAAENFCRLGDKIAIDGRFEMKDIIKAFDVEALSKEFFEKYKVHYGRFVAYVIGKEYVDKGGGKGEWRDKDGLSPSALFYGLGSDEKLVRDYVKKLLGRIVFLHFLQKKGWLGATDENWTNGPEDFMTRLYDKSSTEQKDNFLDEILEPLFSCLDTPLTLRSEVFDTKVDGLRSVRMPFLGGLFERTSEDKARSVFPAELFANLFRFLSEYNFTIDENDPNDAQVGVDPEMLGRIFENLLEDNKDKGAFYTPKEIVQYMCRESLIAYLQTGVTDQGTLEALRHFVITHDVALLGGKDSSLAGRVSRKLKEVRICDPAIGSGAFPMGLLNELFLCRGVIEDFSNAAEIKRHIIQQNIYGVDIEKGAVEIARLRFWLSLITDADKPDVLPNMDFKIMQGNSLLEQYDGIDLRGICDLKDDKSEPERNLFGEIEVKQLTITFSERTLSDNLQNSIQAFFRATKPDEKARLRNQVGESVRELIKLNIKARRDCAEVTIDSLTTGECKTANQFRALEQARSDLKRYNDALERIASLPMQNSDFFLWHTWFADVFDKGGFDIVIGNPPYVEAKKLKYIASTLKPLFKVYSGTADLSIYFVEHGLNLLSPKGILSYITTNKFFNTGYGKPLRKLIVSNDVNKIINFEQVEVFEGVLVSSVILETRKSAPRNSEFIYEKFYKLNAKQFKEQFTLRTGSFGSYPLAELNENEWSFSNDSGLIIKQKIEGGRCLLGDVDGVNIYRGVTTGYNPAFIIDNRKRDELIAADSKNADIIKNMLQGRNIRKWYYNESDENLIFTRKGTVIEDYPFIKSYLFQFYNCLKAKAPDGTGEGRKPGKYKWFEILDNTAYYGEFERPEKIIWGLTADKWAYTLDTEKHYLPSNGYILTSTHIPIKYILGLMNSKVLHYYFGFIGVMTAGGAYTLKAATISALPFADTDDYEPIITLVDQILTMKKQNPQADTSALEHEIDHLVYDLYGLDAEDIAIIEAADKQ